MLCKNLLTVSSTDYRPVSTVLMFDTCETRHCTVVTIVEDVVLENVEMFSATLSRTPGLDPRIHLNPVVGTVEIIDGSKNIYPCI